MYAKSKDSFTDLIVIVNNATLTLNKPRDINF